MEWFTDIAPSLTGLPWPAVFVVVLLTIGLTKGVTALLKYLGFGFEREKYRDGIKKQEHDALVEELKDRIDALAKEVSEVKQEAREDRLTASRLLADEKAAHVECKIAVAELRGEVRLAQQRIAALERHDKNNIKQVEVLQESIRKIDPEAELPPPIEPIKK